MRLDCLSQNQKPLCWTGGHTWSPKMIRGGFAVGMIGGRWCVWIIWVALWMLRAVGPMVGGGGCAVVMVLFQRLFCNQTCYYMWWMKFRMEGTILDRFIRRELSGLCWVECTEFTLYCLITFMDFSFKITDTANCFMKEEWYEKLATFSSCALLLVFSLLVAISCL